MSVLGPYEALGLRFTVMCGDVALAEHIGRSFSSLSAPHVIANNTFLLRRPSSGDGAWQLLVNGRPLLEDADELQVYTRLLWQINAGVISHTPDQVLLHAAAAEVDGRAVILSAPPESGKTTLVAGLVLAGMQYITDETVAIAPSNRRITPWPKALSIDSGSWPVLPQLDPRVPSQACHLVGSQWQVPPENVRPGCIAEESVPALVILPHYSKGGATRADAISPGETLVALLRETFALTRKPARDMKVLAEVAESCPGYRVEVGDLQEAVTLVGALLADS